MYAYIKGIIKEIGNNYVVIETNNIGYLVYMANSFSFHLEEDVKIYTYLDVNRDNVSTLYGFKNIYDKELFLKLISVKGLGCKMALPILMAPYEEVMGAIETGNINYLKKFPKIGDKVARQIILDLKGKLVQNENNNFSELKEVLNSLGYKNNEINKILDKINNNDSIENQVKMALKLLLKWGKYGKNT